MEATDLEPPESRRTRRRLQREAREARRLRESQRDVYLLAQLQPGETVVAVRGEVLVTDRSVLFAWDLPRAHAESRWSCDALAFEEITCWSLGRRHDERPLLRLEHPTHVRTERVAAHDILWFHWGNAEADVPHDDVMLPFGSDRDEAFRAIHDRLRDLRVPRSEDFRIVLPGTRDERTRGTTALLRA